MPPAADIDHVIALAAVDIANVSYLNVHSLFTQMNLWIVGAFGVKGSPSTGIFPAAENNNSTPGQRAVTDWLAATLQARDAIEGPGVGAAKLVGTCETINAVERATYAVKYARIAGQISAAQQTAVVALYNTVWQPV